MLFESHWPRKIVCGENALSSLSILKIKRAAIVVSGSFRKHNLENWERLIQILDEKAILWREFQSQGREPTLDFCKKIGLKMCDFAPDAIISIGGGSTLDAAKAMEIYYEHPDISDTAIAARFALPKIRTKAQHISIPTTSGTGSEVSPFSVVSVETGNAEIPYTKMAIADYQTIPDLVLLDPSLTASMPPSVTAATGMDAFVHAVESFSSLKPQNPFTDIMALESIKLIFKWLPIAIQEPENMQARSQMQIASTLAGMSLSSRGAGLAHGAGHQIGPAFHLPHGVAVSIILKPVMKLNASTRLKEYAQIAYFCGIEAKTDSQAFEALLTKIDMLLDIIKFPRTIGDLGISCENFMLKMDFLIPTSLENSATKANPVIPDAAQMKDIFMTLL
ncbi:MAG: iron-containing alcohol dehydrogenase [Synergistaceae bacterium]|nr:iron-containing alcohol dehydrogenase [Synergistaceae bacterium]